MKNNIENELREDGMFCIEETAEEVLENINLSCEIAVFGFGFN